MALMARTFFLLLFLAAPLNVPLFWLPCIQPDQIDIAVVVWYLVKSGALLNSSVHWTSHILQGTSNTRPCLTGHPVYPGGEMDVSEASDQISSLLIKPEEKYIQAKN